MSVFSASVFIGPVMGYVSRSPRSLAPPFPPIANLARSPIIGGFVTMSYLGWRWVCPPSPSPVPH